MDLSVAELRVWVRARVKVRVRVRVRFGPVSSRA